MLKSHQSRWILIIFSDDSSQNAATTFEHMKKLYKWIIAQKLIGNNGIIYDATDWCSKQYQCANALWILSVLAVTHGITIDRLINAPGHGRNKIDGINGADKTYIWQKMCMISTDESNNEKRRIEAFSMVTDRNINVKSFRYNLPHKSWLPGQGWSSCVVGGARCPYPDQGNRTQGKVGLASLRERIPCW